MPSTRTLLQIIPELIDLHATQQTGNPGHDKDMPWHTDDVLQNYLKSQTSQKGSNGSFRFAVYHVNTSQPMLAGVVVGGDICVGDEVMVAASLKRSRVKHISGSKGVLQKATVGDSANLSLEDTIGVKQGDILHKPGETLERSDQFQAQLLWLNKEPMLPERSYQLMLGPQSTSVQITHLKYAVDLNTGNRMPASTLEQHKVAICNFATAHAIAFDSYADNADTGTFILMDRISQQVVAAGIIDYGLHRGQNLSWQSFEINRSLRAGMKRQKPAIVWFTGLSASGKSSIADVVEQKLAAQDHHTYLLDGDNFRHGLNKDLGFTDADRVENIRRVAEVARLMADSGLIVMTAFISPFRRERRMAREIAGDIEFIEVFVDTPLAICEARDPKGMYAKARRGEIPNFTGISSAYEAPEKADIHLVAGQRTAEELADEVLQKLQLR